MFLDVIDGLCECASVGVGAGFGVGAGVGGESVRGGNDLWEMSFL